MGPIAHVGITAGAGHVLNRVSHIRLNLGIVAISALLPDLVDKPLALVGIGDGRYIGHTLLFIFVAAALLSLKNKFYGLSLLFGGICHLLEDSGGLVPWFYPFADYNFAVNFDPGGSFARLDMLFMILKRVYLNPFILGIELLGLAIIVGLLYNWRRSSQVNKVRK